MDYRITRVQFTLHHKPGKTNVKADLLSRRSDHKRGENDNEDITMLKPEWFRCMEVGIDGQDKDFVERIEEAMLKKKIVDRVIKKALTGHGGRGPVLAHTSPLAANGLQGSRICEYRNVQLI